MISATFGNAPEPTLVLTGDDSVAPSHVEIEMTDQGAVVRATREIMLNGKRTIGDDRLVTGDVVRVGRSFVRFEDKAGGQR